MSTGIKFLYNFAVGDYDLSNPGANVLSVTSQADGFDKMNLTTMPLRESWRSGSDISTWQEIVIQANSTDVVPDVFALLNHNLSSLAVVQVQGSMTSDFSAPAFSSSVLWTEKHMVLLEDVGVAYNYYRFRILDPSNACGFVEVGKIVAGKSFTFTNNEDITDDVSVTPEDLAYKTKTEGFFRASNQRVIVDKLSVSFSKLLTDPANNQNVNFLGLMQMIKTCGTTFPFLTIVDPSDQAFIIHWGQIDSLPTRGFGINRYASMPLMIQEVY